MTTQFTQFPPTPNPSESWAAWARRLVNFLSNPVNIKEANEPRAVQLAHQIGSGNIGAERAVTDGILMFDPVTEDVVVSIDGEWRKLATHRQVLANFVYAAYGSVAMSSETSDANIGAGWSNLDSMDQTLVESRGCSVAPPGVITFTQEGVYQLTLMTSFSHNSSNSGRTTNYRFYNSTDATPSGVSFTLATGRNAVVTSFTAVGLFDVTADSLNKDFIWQVGGGSTYSSVSWVNQSTSVSGSGEYRGTV